MYIVGYAGRYCSKQLIQIKTLNVRCCTTKIFGNTYLKFLIFFQNLMLLMIHYYCFCFRINECIIVGAWSIGNALAFTPNFNKGLVAAEKIFALLGRVPLVRNTVCPIRELWVIKHLQL